MSPRAVLAVSLAVTAAGRPECAGRPLTPACAVQLVAGRISYENVSDSGWATWKYGDAIIVEALTRASTEVKGLDYDLWTNKVLDRFLDDTKGQAGGFAQQVLKNITVPFQKAIGDGIGLYPIAYLSRVVRCEADPQGAAGCERKDLDLEVATRTASRYILPWPKVWTDGAISRDTSGHWTQEVETNSHEFIWGDDALMGLGLVNKLLLTGKIPDAATRKVYADFVADQVLKLRSHLRDPVDGLYFHGANAKNGHHSCCKWSRANGWTLMAELETLMALNATAEADPKAKASVLVALQDHAEALAKVQNKTDGRWHQVLNETSTYLETSGTAMYTHVMATALLHGWLLKADFESVVDAAWGRCGMYNACGISSVIKVLDEYPHLGEVDGICSGFGIHANLEDYKNCPTIYAKSSPGLGSVLRAALAMTAYEATRARNTTIV